MRQFGLVATLLFAVAQLGSAASCASGTLGDYIGLGAGGCTIGTNTLYDFGVVSGSAPAIAPTDITISPLGGTSNPGITADVSLTANGNIVEAIFTYRISGNSYTGESVTLASPTETGNGTASDAQNFCAGGTFDASGVAGCTGMPGQFALVDGVLNQDSTSFPAVGLLGVTDDFVLDASQGGTVSGGSITDQFTAGPSAAVPEPFTFSLAGLGFALAVGLTLRSHYASSSNTSVTKRPL